MPDEFPERPVEVDDNTFDEFVKKYPIVVVDCWADWCMPCKMLSPVVEELAKDLQGKIAFGKLDVDSNHGTAQKYGIMSIPTLLVFKNGELVDNIIGAMPKQVLEPKLKVYLD
ncbi:MAG: thioredoxin [Candidatus Micrarchaeota archaeon]|nr:thioredoxin [Candidatus Micrarchaeota archaeon]